VVVRTIEAAIVAALDYLQRRQDEDGRWRDYDLPVGESGEWVSAYVGFCGLEACRKTCGDCWPPASRAADSLLKFRAYPAGWGYNEVTGPDADSTAWTLRLLRLLDWAPPSNDVAFLLEHWLEEGGFRTFRCENAWGAAHVDVTPIVAMALPIEVESRLRPSIVRFLTMACEGGGWPSYWWRTTHYASASVVEYLRTVGVVVPDTPAVADDDMHALHTWFDVACALLASGVSASSFVVTELLVNSLLDAQQADGSWPGDLNLRVPDPDRRGSRRLRGTLYEDCKGLLTTATAVRALARQSMTHRCDC
jgi:hypothetical protein